MSSDLNVLKLSEKLESIRKELERGVEAEASIDGVRVAAGIQQYISNSCFKVTDEQNLICIYDVYKNEHAWSICQYVNNITASLTKVCYLYKSSER